jgi:beta-N-acetylhexosaminidase
MGQAPHRLGNGGARRTAALVVTAAALALAVPGSSWGRTTRTPQVADTGRACTTTDRIHGWALRRLAWQTVIVPVAQTHVAEASREVKAGAGGVILFGSQAPTDLRSRLGRLVSSPPHGLLPIVMTDEEGGSVQRMPNLVGSMPSARYMGKHWTPHHIRRVARFVATKMRSAHVTMDLAPVLDLDGRAGPNARDAIGSRSFSPKVKVATKAGMAFARGMRDGGVVPVVKHFPGIGAADGNTDLRRAKTPPWRRVRTHDLLPFRSAIEAGLPAVMVGNARVPGLTKRPASISRAVVHGVLRRDLGFRGLLIPDSLTARAVASRFGLPHAAVTALRVGEDMVLFNTTASRLWPTSNDVVSAIVSAVREGTLSRARLENAVGHVLTAKSVDLCADR